MGAGANGTDAGVLPALRAQEMDGERLVNHCRAGLLLAGTVDLALVHQSCTPAAARSFFGLGVAFAVYIGALYLLLRDRGRYDARLKYVTVFFDIAFAYGNSIAAFLNYSDVYAVYRSPLMWLLLAGSNAMSGLRHSTRASLFAGGLTLAFGAIELAAITRLPVRWSQQLHFVGAELNFGNCVQTIFWAAMPAWYAAVVAYRSRRLVTREAQLAMERALAEERHRSAVAEVSTLRELAEAKDRFLSIASHELRSPVAAMQANVQMMRLNPEVLADPQTRQQTIERLSQRGERLVKLVRQLLDSSRLGRGEVPLEHVRCDLAKLCRESLDGLAETESARIAIEATEPVIGSWDVSRLEQVIINLVSNALRYSPRDSVVRVRVVAEETRAILTVADRGIGIPADQMGRLFTPFFRATEARHTDRGGLGLGLYVTHEIVRRHGGTIRVTSTEGAGTRFTVELPRGLTPSDA